MTKRKLIYYLIFAILFCAGCDGYKHCPEGSHDRIQIVNNSNIAVNWKFDSPNDSAWTNNGSTYPATTDGFIAPNSTYEVAAGLEHCWEYTYQEGSQNYFIYSHDTVEAIGWQAISGTNRGLLKRVKVDLDYLKNNNFTISYP